MPKPLVRSGLIYGVHLAILLVTTTDLVSMAALPVMGLVVFAVNAAIDERGREGLGLSVNRAKEVLTLSLMFGLSLFVGRLLLFNLEGISLEVPSVDFSFMRYQILRLVLEIGAVGFWEELIYRGYIQTRLEESWGFKGVLVASFLFGTAHIPSVVFQANYGVTGAAWRVAQTTLSGLMFGYIYMATKSVLLCSVFHGVRNFAWHLIASIALTNGGLLTLNIPFQLFWLLAETSALFVLGEKLFFAKSPNFSAGEGK